MKKAILTVTLCTIIFTGFPTAAFEAGPLAIPRFELLMPGVTRTIEVVQDADFPMGTSQIWIGVIGYGGVRITLSKIDTEGDVLVLTGVGMSSAGIIPILKFGRTGVNLSEDVAIGDDMFPFGVVWISSWINPPVPEPPYNAYRLQLQSFLTF